MKLRSPLEGAATRYYNGVTLFRTTRCCRTAYILHVSFFIQAAFLCGLAAAPRRAPLAAFPVELAWTAELAAAPSARAAFWAGRAFVPLRSGQLAAVSLDDASVAWAIDLATTVAPVAGADFVYALSADTIHALNPADGATRWRASPGGALSAPLLWNNGWLIACIEGGDVIAYRGETGEELWRQSLGGSLKVAPTIEAERLYVPVEEGRVLALDLLTGRQVWSTKLGGSPADILATADRLYVGARDNYFYCLDARDGDLEWQTRAGGDIIGRPGVDAQRVYFVALDNVLRALDRESGNQRWLRPLATRPFAGPLIVGSLVVVSGLSPELRAYDAQTGEPAGEFTVPSELTGPPYLAPGPSPALSTLVVLTGDGRLHALRRKFDPYLVPLETLPGTAVPITPEGVGPVVPTEFIPGVRLPPEPPPPVTVPPSRPIPPPRARP